MRIATTSGIKTTVLEGEIIERSGQCYDGFKIIVHDDEEFGGEYVFDHSYDQSTAHKAIFAGDVSPEGDN